MQVMVYDKTYKRRGLLGAPTKIDFDIINNAVSTATIEIPAHRPRVQDALADGARVVIEEPGVESFSGKVVKRGGAGPQEGSVTLTVESDWRLLTRLLGWPVPSKPIAQQGTAYRKYTGTAEDIAKDVIREAVTRTGEQVTVAPSQGRGSVIPGGIQFRFHPLVDRLFPAIEQAGLSLTVVQDGENGLLVDVREPTTVRKPFSAAAGTLVDWEWSEANPTATAAIVGGQGVGELRTLKEKRSTALEARYADKVEVFIDARDTDDATELDTRINETLMEGAPTSGLTLTLANSRSARYGKHYRVGDLVTINTGILNVTDTLRRAQFSWTRETGLVITPEVGERTDDPDTQLAKRVRKLWQGLTNLKVGR